MIHRVAPNAMQIKRAMMSQMGAAGVLNKMKSDGRGVQTRTALAKEYLQQLR